jgi:hypothetical protein
MITLPDHWPAALTLSGMATIRIYAMHGEASANHILLAKSTNRELITL